MKQQLAMTLPESASPAHGPLSPSEAERLTDCEAVIGRGLKSFVEVGSALLEISDKRLYRATHATFKAYVEDKWKLKVRRAYQLCEAAEVVNQMGDVQNFA